MVRTPGVGSRVEGRGRAASGGCPRNDSRGASRPATLAPPPRPGSRAPPPATSGGRATRSAARHRSRPRAALPTPGRRADACVRLPTRRPPAAAATTTRVTTVRQGLLLTSAVVASVAPTAGSNAEPERGSTEHEHLKELPDLHRVSSRRAGNRLPFSPGDTAPWSPLR